MKIFIRRAAVALAVAALAAAPAAAQDDVGLPVGTRAPNPAVFTLDGQPANLGAYLGKTPMLIEFWATWCPNCRELRPTMDAMAAKYGKQIQFVGIAVSVNENPARVKAFVAKYHLPGINFFDTNGDATDKYAAPATSYVVVVNRAGRIVYTGVGGKQDLEAAIKKAL
ncbi:MAG: TlpA family protein disulfide reductase [Gemmatimonadota bacterium]|nr:TlpA family protein disulfide reductase [Gemmatimonadota bacterium]